MAAAPGMWRLEARDWLVGAMLAVASGVVSFLQQFVFPMGGVPNFDFSQIHWKVVAGAAMASFITYIGKNLTTNKKGEVLGIKATQPQAMRGK